MTKSVEEGSLARHFNSTASGLTGAESRMAGWDREATAKALLLRIIAREVMQSKEAVEQPEVVEAQQAAETEGQAEEQPATTPSQLSFAALYDDVKGWNI